jgi:hypothetical protein
VARQRDFAAEYARRKARGLAAGRTLQQARGHKPAEHVERAIRERRERGLSSAEERVVRRWGQLRHDGGAGRSRNADLVVQDLVDWSASVGYAAFKAFRYQNDAANRQYRQEQKRKRYASRGPEALAGFYGSGGDEGGYEDDPDFDFDYDPSDLDVAWLYYH